MKPVVAGLLTFVVFFFGNSYLLGGLGQLCLIGGDAFVNSYFAPVMTGLALLAALVVGCTWRAAAPATRARACLPT